MRKILALAAALALLSTPAFAQLAYAPSQQGSLGNKVTATDTNGNAGRFILPSATLYDSSGVEKGTQANPTVDAPFTARTALPTALANGAATPGTADAMGRPIVQLGSLPQFQYNSGPVALANTTETNVMVGSALQRLGIHTLNIYNADTVTHTFSIRLSSGGAVQKRYAVAAGASVDFCWPEGIWTGTNANVTAQMGEAVTTTGPTVYMTGYQIAG